MPQIFIYLITSLLISHIFLTFTFPYLKKNNLDIPNKRSSHIEPKPKSGGISFVLTSIIGAFLDYFINGFNFSIYSILICFPLAIMGFIDDKYNIKVNFRFGFQIFTGILILKSFINNNNDTRIILIPLILITIISIINFVNFMDGVDGMVAGCMIISIATQNLRLNSNLSIWFLVGGLIGFLFWNWNPAKIFMGDTGSTFLGAIFAALALNQESLYQSFFSMFLAFPILSDAFFCVIIRYKNKQNIFQPHKSHLYQRLHQSGWPHYKVSLLYISGTLLCSISYLILGVKGLILITIIEFCIGIFLDKYYAKSFAKSIN